VIVQIRGKDFGPVTLVVRNGIITTADRPISYMRTWPLQRALRLAERWGWRVDLTPGEKVQLGQTVVPAP
jgi:hypothetical protein